MAGEDDFLFRVGRSELPMFMKMEDSRLAMAAVGWWLFSGGFGGVALWYAEQRKDFQGFKNKCLGR